MRQILQQTDTRAAIVRLTVLVESDANRFYRRPGFFETHRQDWDVCYERQPPAALAR